jgi:hypothetical protein
MRLERPHRPHLLCLVSLSPMPDPIPINRGGRPAPQPPAPVRQPGRPQPPIVAPPVRRQQRPIRRLQPPVVPRPARRRWSLTDTAIVAGFALVALLIYVLWPGPSAPPPKYLVADMQSHGSYITSIAFSPNGNTIASAGADDAFDWSNIDGSNAGHSGSYVGPCDAVAFAPDNSQIIAGCSTGVQT